MSDWIARLAAPTALALFLVLLVLGSVWETHSQRRDGEARLQQDAVSLAKRSSLHLAGVSWDMDAPAARSFVFTEMEDPRLAAILIFDRTGLLEGMRRNEHWDIVPWDDLTPENSVSASAPITIEEVQVGEVILHLSRRALEEELSAGARREIARVAVLAVIPCILLALFLWRLAALRAARDAQTQADGRRESDPSPLRLPTDWNIPDARRAYLEACRVFLRERRNEAALLCRLAAAEDWKGLHEAAGALREAALTVNARALAAAALSVQEAALADAASAARHVEHCIPPLFEVLDEAERLLRDNADPALKDMT